MSATQPPTGPASPHEPTPTEGTTPGGTTAGQPATATPSEGASSSKRGADPLRGSRTSGVWLAVVAIGIILVLLIIFIAQNTEPASIRFLGWEGEAPLAVSLLIATVAGLFLATAAGSLRILQLRRRVRRGNR